MPGEVVVVDRKGRSALSSAARGLFIAARRLVGAQRFDRSDGRPASHADRRMGPVLADAWADREDGPKTDRGVPMLLRDERGEPRCTRCGDCERICPSRCIRVVAEGDSHAEGQTRFELDLSRCSFCGLCEDVCRDEAIAMSGRIAGANIHRDALTLDEHELLALERRLPARIDRPPIRPAEPPWRGAAE